MAFPSGRTRRGAGRPVAAHDAAADVDPESHARALCLRQLTLGPRSRGQLLEMLHRREVPQESAERVLDRLTEVGLVDDVAFAETWVRSRTGTRGLSRRVLAAELRAKGVDDEVVADAVAAVGPEDEESMARALVARRLSATRRLEPEVRLRRLTAMLARKGYPGGLAVRVVREALTAEGAGDVMVGALEDPLS